MQGKVSVGLSTVTGYGVTVIAFASAVVAYLTGDHSQQTIGTIVAGGIAALAFAITQIGRYAQAKAQIPHTSISHYGGSADDLIEKTKPEPAGETSDTVMLDLDGDGHADPYVHTSSGGFEPAGSSGPQSNAGAVTLASPDPHDSIEWHMAEGPGDPLPRSLEPLVPADEPAPAEHSDEGDARQAVVA